MTVRSMAESYWQSAGLLHARIRELRDQSKTAGPVEKTKLEQRIRDLNSMYRETKETAAFLERYYDRRYHDNGRSEV